MKSQNKYNAKQESNEETASFSYIEMPFLPVIRASLALSLLGP